MPARRTWGLWPAALLLSGCMAHPEMLTEGQAAPPLSGADAAHQSLRLDDYRGQVVLLDFWRTG
jgi:hypothetical protein